MKRENDMREELAELAHKQWSGWMDYLFSKCIAPTVGELIIPKWAVERWKRQANTPYEELSNDEKNTDRDEADKFLALFDTEITRLRSHIKGLEKDRDHQALKRLENIKKADEALNMHIASEVEVRNLQSQLNALKWIPVAEGLPENYYEYLVLPYHKHCPTLWYQDDEWWWYSHQSDAIEKEIGNNLEPIFKVTHWMPIPTLPKQGE